ncbi:MAG: putative DNA-binding protein [Gammaproteobacteria bacterium]|nr:putative DNA-binding protein [Gammaproteobacteria bacterium]
MDGERLKQNPHWDYFDEWLARIREIRTSEKRFYQKIKDLFVTAVNYDKTSQQAQLFFKQVQDKMLWAESPVKQQPSSLPIVLMPISPIWG